MTREEAFSEGWQAGITAYEKAGESAVCDLTQARKYHRLADVFIQGWEDGFWEASSGMVEVESG